jgi:hypothetical protein
MHGSITNTSADRLRINCDCRFQPAATQVDCRLEL